MKILMPAVVVIMTVFATAALAAMAPTEIGNRQG